MNKDLSIKTIKTKFSAYAPVITKHMSFIIIILVLLVYLFTVFRISQFSNAEPSTEAQSSSEVASTPKIDQKAIDQVQQLENNSPQVHSLLNQARNNPFGE